MDSSRITMEDILADSSLRNTFHNFASKRFGEENIEFVNSYLELKEEIACGGKNVVRMLHVIFASFIDAGSSNELNLDCKLMLRLRFERTTIMAAEDHSEVIKLFEPLYRHISDLIETNFIASFSKEVQELKSRIDAYACQLPLRNDRTRKSHQKRVVIIGGGFTGLLVAKFLDSLDGFQVVLIDKKPAFEHTPAMIKAIVNPDVLDKITVSYESSIKFGAFIQASATSISEKCVTIGKTQIDFDYCVLSLGSSYGQTFKSSSSTSEYRKKNILSGYEALKKNDNVLVVGGGLVGVEIASEIKDTFKHKRVILIHAHSKLVKSFPQAASDLSLSKLRKMGVEVYLNERIIDYSPITDTYVSSTGSTYTGTICYMAGGPIANTDLIKKMDPTLLNAQGLVNCELTLQVTGHPHMFVGGDIKSLEEPRVAQNAINDGFLIIENIMRLNSGAVLKRRGSSGVPAIKKIIALGFSTGIHSGVFIQPIGASMSVVIPLPIVSFVKNQFQTSVLRLMSGVRGLSPFQHVLFAYLFTRIPNVSKFETNIASETSRAQLLANHGTPLVIAQVGYNVKKDTEIQLLAPQKKKEVASSSYNSIIAVHYLQSSKDTQESGESEEVVLGMLKSMSQNSLKKAFPNEVDVGSLLIRETFDFDAYTSDGPQRPGSQLLSNNQSADSLNNKLMNPSASTERINFKGRRPSNMDSYLRNSSSFVSTEGSVLRLSKFGSFKLIDQIQLIAYECRLAIQLHSSAPDTAEDTSKVQVIESQLPKVTSSETTLSQINAKQQSPLRVMTSPEEEHVTGTLIIDSPFFQSSTTPFDPTEEYMIPRSTTVHAMHSAPANHKKCLLSEELSIHTSYEGEVGEVQCESDEEVQVYDEERRAAENGSAAVEDDVVQMYESELESVECIEYTEVSCYDFVSGIIAKSVEELSVRATRDPLSMVLYKENESRTSSMIEPSAAPNIYAGRQY